MKKTLQIALLILFAVGIVLSTGRLSYAETVPNSDDYIKCDIYINGERITQPATLINGNIYIDIDTLQQYGATEGFEFDTKNLYIWLDVSGLDMYFGDDQATAFIKANAGRVQFPMKRFNTRYDSVFRYYVSLQSIASFAKLSCEYKNYAVYITPYSDIKGPVALASGNENAVASLKNENADTALYKNEPVSIVKETTSFYQIKDRYGVLSYVCKEDITIAESIAEIPDFSASRKDKELFDGPANIVWSKLKHAPDKITGIDAFVNININQYPEDTGACKQTCDYGFIQSAHANGYKVWLCCMNGFATTAKGYISANLANESAADKTLAQYLFYAMVYNADGISLDYESMSYTNGKDKGNFLRFVEKLGYYCDRLGLVSSVAVYYGTTYNNSHMYDYGAIGNSVDYILEMTYGENFAYSLSNMSKSYWKAGTDLIAGYTDPKKVFMGVAYHMRYTVWDDEGNMLKSSKPTMKQIMADLLKYNIPYSWDEYTGQYYAEELYESSDGKLRGLARYYLEEERSSALKAQYIVDSGLGGTIGWEYGYNDYPGNEKSYAVYDAIYNQGKSYQDFVPAAEPVGPVPPAHDELGKVIIGSKPISDRDDGDGNSDEYHEND